MDAWVFKYYMGIEGHPPNATPRKQGTMTMMVNKPWKKTYFLGVGIGGAPLDSQTHVLKWWVADWSNLSNGANCDSGPCSGVMFVCFEGVSLPIKDKH